MGIISPVFTYIFVIIVGAVIIGFFTTFAFQQVSLGTKLSSIAIAKTLDDNFNAFSISKSSDRDIDFGYDINLLFNNLVCGTLSLENGNDIRTNKVIFSPRSLKGEKIKAWTLSWKYPYHITNFFYLSNDNSIYYLVYDGNTQRYVEDKFFDDNSQYRIPSRFNIRRIQKSDINNALVSNLLARNNFVKLAYFSAPPQNIINLIQTSNNKLKIIEIDNDDNKVKFYNENIEETLLSDEFIVGAIFSEDYNGFKCGFDEAISKIKSVSRLYLAKKDKLNSKLTQQYGNSACGYGLITNNLNYFINNNPDINSFNEYRNNWNNLIINNNNLEGEDNCEALF